MDNRSRYSSPAGPYLKVARMCNTADSPDVQVSETGSMPVAPPRWPVTKEETAAVQAAGLFGGGGLGSGIASGREAADGAAALVANAQRILTDLETGAKGLDLTIGPFDVLGITIPAIPLHFKLAR